MNEDMKEIAQRIQGIREACDISVEEMAADLEVPVETYVAWEEAAGEVPISAIYHIACKCGVDMTEILTGTNAKLDTYHIVRCGEGKVVNRHPDYHFEDLAWRYQNKIMQPLVVTLDPSDNPAELITHQGQEFNFIVDGSIVFVFDDKEIILNKFDSVYFNPEHKHGQRCNGNKPATFITIIAE